MPAALAEGLQTAGGGVDGRLVKRRIGPKREPGGRVGLTPAQAEGKLRDLMRDAEGRRPVEERLDVA